MLERNVFLNILQIMSARTQAEGTTATFCISFFRQKHRKAVVWLLLSFSIISIVGKQKVNPSGLQRIFIKNSFLPFVICNIFPKGFFPAFDFQPRCLLQGEECHVMNI
jgi:membrane-bound acyltransferase YfiQ involved in biofilm formation